MTEKEIDKLIKEKNIKPFSIGSSFHCYSEEYEIDGYYVIYIWSTGSSQPLIEFYNIKDQFEEDYKVVQSGCKILKILPDKIYDRELLKYVMEKLKDRVLFPKRNCNYIFIDGLDKNIKKYNV